MIAETDALVAANQKSTRRIYQLMKELHAAVARNERLAADNAILAAKQNTLKEAASQLVENSVRWSECITAVVFAEDLDNLINALGLMGAE